MRTSYGWPITLAVVMIVLVVALIVGWIVLTVRETSGSVAFWVLLLVGTLFLVLVLVGVVLYLLISIKGIRLNQRQSNFMDSVSHELKSPIASLKLYLQTLARRSVTEQQQANFYRFMLDDVERLDSLINHMLDAARLDQQPIETDIANVELSNMLRSCAETACLRYHLPIETIRLSATGAMLRARPIDIEMVFRNLIDNAIKYGGAEPVVEIDSQFVGDSSVVTRVIDNGPGIPAKLRRKIFGRFVRLGSELERSQSGTGLGLFIVRTLVKRLHGKITVRDRGHQPGTIFEVQLPARPVPSADDPSSASRPIADPEDAVR
ncbi:MAG TPA: HAMP domain-containing sensor histidine kinase [Pirellulales bacterium]|nr:HAMP domain-containing sensor histidine kinase [Pirellulales bacterium]